jgi:drug/metabolite transporter (DMT)-like permease
MLNNFAYPLLGSEIALSLYPQLIKLLPTTIEIQIAVRCITYSVLALLGYFINCSGSGNTIESKSKTNSLFFYILMGIVNIFHIASSYISYKILPSGIAYSLFYTYPIFNLLFRTIFFGESIKFINYIYIIIAIIGVYFIYRDSDSDSDSKNNTISNNTISTNSVSTNTKESSTKESYDFITKFTSKDTLVGLVSGIGSAFTESLMYLMVKADVSSISPFIQVLKTYVLGGILSVGYLIKNIDKINLDWHYWTTLILFNALVGFVGYVIRFFTIPRLTTIAFNSLIFIGVLFSYIWGYLFSNEKIKIINVLGTLLIVGSVFKINN